ncbi:MAG: tetratricopeptide repeat-containing sensor histidine kinase [Bacteroidales bacterium]|nr:tetratricopeptide repeat-containing sensor histidine kinase [Bacteroidales bacterium]
MKSKILVLLLSGVIFSNLAFSEEKVSPIDSCFKAAKQYEAVSDLYNAALCYSDGIKLARKNDESKLPELLIAYCRALTYLGDYAGALANLEEAELRAPRDNESFRGRVMTAYGTIYFFQGNFDESLKYYEEALVCAHNHGMSSGIAIAQTNVACVYGEKKEYDKAVEMFKKSLETLEEVKDSSSISNTLYNIALCYIDLENYEEASIYLKQAMDVAETSNIEIYTLCLQGLAKVEAYNGNYEEAERLLNESERIADENHFRQALQSLYKEKKTFYVKLGRYREAYESLSKYQEFSDSLFSEDTKSKLNTQRIRFELREKELQIEDQKNTIEQQRMMRLFLFIVIGLLLVLIAMIIRIWHIQRVRNKELLEINSTKDKFLSIISHDLKNPALAIRNVLQVLADNYETLSRDEILELGIQVLQTSEEQVKLIYDLLNWSQMEVGRMPYNPTDLKLVELADNVARLNKMIATSKGININVEVPDDVIVYADKNMIETVLRNLISNAIKFSNENSEIKISVADAGRQYVVSVIDNGVGISKERIDGIFSMDANKSTIGTNGETGNGLGLAVCDQMVRKNGGQISVESELGKYTKFNFTINKANVKSC